MANVALLTDCEDSVGLLTAVQLAQAGLRVFAGLGDLRHIASVKAAAAAAGIELYPVPLDVRSAGAVAAAVDRVSREAGGIDVLVNAVVHHRDANSRSEPSGGGGGKARVDDSTDGAYLAAVRCIKAVLPQMRERRSGHIVTLSPGDGRFGHAADTATRYALTGLTSGLARYLQEHFQVKMTLVAPLFGHGPTTVAEALATCVFNGQDEAEPASPGGRSYGQAGYRQDPEARPTRASGKSARSLGGDYAAGNQGDLPCF